MNCSKCENTSPSKREVLKTISKLPVPLQRSLVRNGIVDKYVEQKSAKRITKKDSVKVFQLKSILKKPRMLAKESNTTVSITNPLTSNEQAQIELKENLSNVELISQHKRFNKRFNQFYKVLDHIDEHTCAKHRHSDTSFATSTGKSFSYADFAARAPPPIFKKRIKKTPEEANILFPSKYKHVKWEKEGAHMLNTKIPYSYWEEHQNPIKNKKDDITRLVVIPTSPISLASIKPGGMKSESETFERNRAYKNKEMLSQRAKDVKSALRLSRKLKNADQHDANVDHELSVTLNNTNPKKDLSEIVEMSLENYGEIATEILSQDMIERDFERLIRNPHIETLRQLQIEWRDRIESNPKHKAALEHKTKMLRGFKEVKRRFNLNVEQDSGEDFAMPQRDIDGDMEQRDTTFRKNYSTLISKELVDKINNKLKSEGFDCFFQKDALTSHKTPHPSQIVAYNSSSNIDYSIFDNSQLDENPLKVAYRKIDDVGIVHHHFKLQYFKDNISNVTYAVPRYASVSKLYAAENLEKQCRINSYGHFCPISSRYIGPKSSLDDKVLREIPNEKFLLSIFGNYMIPVHMAQDPDSECWERFLQCLDELNANT